MPIGAGQTFGATLLLSLALGATSVAAQTSAGGTWTDPPTRSAPATRAVAPPVPAATAGTVGSGESKGGTVAESKPSATPASVSRRAAVRDGGRARVVSRARTRIVSDRAPARIVRPRVVERPARRAVVTRSFAQRYDAAPAFAFDPRPMPVGRADDGFYGERNPIFADGDDRTRRIAAAQAAGYLVVRARSVQFPDGRTLRTYRPYEGEDGFD